MRKKEALVFLSYNLFFTQSMETPGIEIRVRLVPEKKPN